MSRFALLSVSDKHGVVELGRALVGAGYTILSTGGTARALREAGVPVKPVSEHTGAPEIFDGRVKTLHPRIHGGLLGDRARHGEQARAQGIDWIDVVAVNLYPFERTVAAGADVDAVIEDIDIGGPAMIRASAKNHRYVTVVVDPADYPWVADAVAGGGTTPEQRAGLARKAFRHTSRYDAAIASWLGRDDPTFDDELVIGLKKVQELRYGENPHQRAAFYADAERTGRSLARAVQRQGKELSYNNLADLDATVRAVFDLEGPACVIVKHANPCGCAVAPTVAEAFERALAGDPVSAYGGIVAFNRPIGPEDVRVVRTSGVFFEVLAAPGFTGDALERLAKRENLRVMELPADWAAGAPPGRDARRVQGGWLVQDWDLGGSPGWEVVTDRAPSDEEARALRFAWAVCRHVKSNAIVLAAADAAGASVNGVGAGQMSRVDSVRLAVGKATRPVAGCVMASDAFFPFADGVEAGLAAGVTAVVQPGGSIRDAEVIAAANAAGAAMVFTGVRHFRH